MAIPFLTDHGLQGHQTWMAGSLDLSFWHSPKDLDVGNLEAKWSGASTLQDLLHTSLGGLVSGAW